jgi:sugar/nucleoside kinase (ribokinase family)
VSKRFVSVGVCIVDIVGTTIESIPDGEGTELIHQIHMCPAGTAAAPAVIAARQGLDSTLIGAVGKDDFGHYLLQKLRSEGVNVDLMQEREDMPTAATILPINGRGERPNWHMPGACLMLEPSAAGRAAIVAADFVHWGGIGLLFNFDGEVAAGIMAEARARGANITADLIAPGDHTPGCVEAVAPHLDWFMPSLEEALQLSDTRSAQAAAEFFMAQGAAGCVIKCGGDGAYIADSAGLSEQVPAIAGVQVVDTSGCGDSFCAGFNVGLANGFDPLTAARFGAATAAQVAAGVGSDAGVVDFATTEKIMQAGSLDVLEEDA